MVSLVPKELPDLRRHLTESMTTGRGPAIIAAQLHGDETDRNNVEPMDVAMAAIDARILQEAELYFVTTTTTSLLTQAGSGIGEAGFMPFDLPGKIGMAYLDGDIPCEQQGHRWNERVVVLWYSIDTPAEECPDGFVHLSWYVDRDMWQQESDFWYPNDNQVRGKILNLPRFLWDGHISIRYSHTAAEVISDRLDRSMGISDDHRGVRAELFRALCYLMRQQVVEQTVRLPDRAAQRRAKREGREPDSIRVLSLRSSHTGGGTSVGREYQHQWVVRGHWRRQWYPSIQGHRPVFIAPHIKGPVDAPLLGGEKVYRVST